MKQKSLGFVLMLLGSLILSLATISTMLAISTEYVTVQASSPVMEGEVSNINIVIKTGVGVSGTAYLFVDETFFLALGGSAGSDGKIYLGTGWNAVGVGNHVLRATFFEDNYPAQPVSASTVILVTSSSVPPDPYDPPDPPDPFDPIDISDDYAFPLQVFGLSTVVIGVVLYYKGGKK